MFDLIKTNNEVVSAKTEIYSQMIANIQTNLPMIKDACSNFGKHQSQFMDNFLTVSHPTPLRNARQILAEMNKIIEALKENQYKISKRKITIKKLERDCLTEKDELKLEELRIEIDWEKSQIETSMLYIEGAVRSLSNYDAQYKLILEKNGYEKMTEEAFEEEEEKYHIMKAFDQAICAARARGGIVDEGNHIYFSQIGVNGKMAETFIRRFFEQEAKAVNDGYDVTHNFLADFLKEMATKFKGCSKFVSERKGNAAVTKHALLRSV